MLLTLGVGGVRALRIGGPLVIALLLAALWALVKHGLQRVFWLLCVDGIEAFGRLTDPFELRDHTIVQVLHFLLRTHRSLLVDLSGPSKEIEEVDEGIAVEHFEIKCILLRES